ncbi:MAG: triose-phosphate isomerase [Gammaproteobacteria bacterium]
MRTTLVAGNWKMNGSREMCNELINELVHTLDGKCKAEVAVCPPYIYLADAARALKGSEIRLGAQSLCAEESGAFTGEIAASMLQDFDCSYVIVGHSERRLLYGEDDTLVARKFMAALKSELSPILCIGESLEEREKGLTEQVVERQLRAVLDVVGIESFSRAVVAYEPVWAIGTGRTATLDQAQVVHAQVRGMLAEEDVTIADSVRIIYGGSVKGANAAELFAMHDIDGGLIGGASLKAGSFIEICMAAG